jgi:hypothetical protein
VEPDALSALAAGFSLSDPDAPLDNAPQMRGPFAWLASLFLIVTGCAKSSPVAGGSPSPSRPSTSLSPSPSPLPVPPIPTGTYETVVTRKDLLSHDSPEFRQIAIKDAAGIAENTGTIDLTLEGGHFTWSITADHPIANPLFTGVYTGTGNVVKLIYDPNNADEGVDTLRWTLRGGCLVFTVISVSPDQPNEEHLNGARGQYESHPWCRVDVG